MAEAYASWEKRSSYTFRARWLSKVDKRRDLAEDLALHQLSQGKKVPDLLQFELAPPITKELAGWHHFFSIESFQMFDHLSEVRQHVKTFCKRSDMAAGNLEILLHDAAAPVRLSKSQRIKLLDTILKGLSAYPFADTDEHHMYDHLETYDEYALWLGVEYTFFRRFIDGLFGDDDNPTKSLVGRPCKVESRAYDAEDGSKPDHLAEGVLELFDNTVRVGNWEQTFDAEDEIFESVAYEEVNIACEALQTAFYLEVLEREADDD